jgi:hypothetical protein
MKPSPSMCGRCGYHSDDATLVTGGARAEPKVGDLSVCLACGAISEFVDGGGQRLMSAAEIAALPATTRFVLTQAQIAQALVISPQAADEMRRRGGRS